MNISEQLLDIAINVNAILRNAASYQELSMSQAYFLLSVPSEGIPMAKLAVLLGIDASTLTRNFNKLQQMGYVNKSQDNNDKRIFHIKLTQEGDIIIDLLNSQIDNSISDIIQKIGIDEIHSIDEILEKLSWNMVVARSEI